MNAKVGKMIGASIGEVEEVGVGNGDVEWGEFLRVRVRVDITKPLPRGKKVSLGDSQTVWVTFKYERLPNFC